MDITICRIVEYTDDNGFVWPALVTYVSADGLPTLTVFTSQGSYIRSDVPRFSAEEGEETPSNTWDWPARSEVRTEPFHILYNEQEPEIEMVPE